MSPVSCLFVTLLLFCSSWPLGADSHLPDGAPSDSATESPTLSTPPELPSSLSEQPPDSRQRVKTLSELRASLTRAKQLLAELRLSWQQAETALEIAAVWKDAAKKCADEGGTQIELATSTLIEAQYKTQAAIYEVGAALLEVLEALER